MISNAGPVPVNFEFILSHKIFCIGDMQSKLNKNQGKWNKLLVHNIDTSIDHMQLKDIQGRTESKYWVLEYIQCNDSPDLLLKK